MLDRFLLQDNGVPIYVQLRDQIVAAIGCGALKPGERLPTMRQVAVALSIDLNTVQRAYGELQRDGLITTIQGRGTYVAATPPAMARQEQRQVQELASKVAAQAKAQGVALADLAEALTQLAGRPR